MRKLPQETYLMPEKKTVPTKKNVNTKGELATAEVKEALRHLLKQERYYGNTITWSKNPYEAQKAKTDTNILRMERSIGFKKTKNTTT